MQSSQWMTTPNSAYKEYTDGNYTDGYPDILVLRVAYTDEKAWFYYGRWGLGTMHSHSDIVAGAGYQNPLDAIRAAETACEFYLSTSESGNKPAGADDPLAALEEAVQAANSN